MNKKDREDVKAIVEEALDKKEKERHTIDLGDVVWCILGSALLLGVFGAMIFSILALAGVL